MTKAQIAKETSGTLVVRDPKDGRFIEVRGANALKDHKLAIRDDIDLTKPIAEQVFGRPPTTTVARLGRSKTNRTAKG